MQLEHSLSENKASRAGALLAPRRLFILGIGGTLRPNSSSELALELALAETERLSADVDMIVGRALELPPYEQTRALAPENAVRLLELLGPADGLIVASAAYHGSIPGFLKNAIDDVEDLREDPLPYLEGRAVGCIICAHGQQALGSALADMVRSFTCCAAGTRPTQSRSVPRTSRSALNRIWITRSSANNCGLLPAKSCNSRQCGSIRRPGFRRYLQIAHSGVGFNRSIM
jgi:NAD(P)H-dependent FMN reductase